MGRILLLLLLVLPLSTRADTLSVRLSTLEWPPYVSESLPDGGYAQAVVRRAFAEAGIAVQIRSYPWARALQLAEQGKVDGVFPEYLAPAERSDLLFSEPFPGGPVGLYKLRKQPIAFAADPRSNPEQALEALAGLRLGLVRGYLNHPALDANPAFTRSFASNDRQNLGKLLGGRVDIIFIDFRVAQHLINQAFPAHAEQFEAMQPALLQPDLYLTLSRNKPDAQTKIAAFNRGLRQLKASGELERLMREHGF
ncbi:substrate-binding periplasmic protein [Pseudomonas borbori]